MVKSGLGARQSVVRNDEKVRSLSGGIEFQPMLHLVSRTISRIQRYDPGALRVVRGIHLTIAVVIAALLAHWLGGFAHGVPGFSLAVVCAGAAGFVLLFTPISTRKHEARDLFLLALVLAGLTGFGAVIGEISGASASRVLQTLWICVIAIGFGLDGLGPFWMRVGRMISMVWLFVILTSSPHSPGIWLPAMALLGVAIAIAVRIGLWRPSAGKTFKRIETSNRRAIAEYLRMAASGTAQAREVTPITLHDLALLRAELEIATDLAENDGELRGLAPETAAMMRLAAEVVRNAMAALGPDVRSKLVSDPGYQEDLQTVLNRVETGVVPDLQKHPDKQWAHQAKTLPREDAFQVLRIAQAFERLWQLSDAHAQIERRRDDDVAPSGNVQFWRRISWQLAVQASAATTVGFAIGHYFQLSHAYWITITVIVVLCSSLGATVQKTLQRIAGTMVGFLAALLLEPVLADLPDLRLLLIVAMMPPIIILFERNYGIAVGFISFMVLIGLEALTGLPVSDFWARLCDTMIGAGAGLLASLLLFPRRSGEGVKGLAFAYLVSCRKVLTDRSDPTLQTEKSNYTDLKKAARKLIGAAQTYRAEQIPWASSTRTGGDLDVLVIVLADYVILYRQARSAVTKEVAGHPNETAIMELLGRMEKRVLDEFDAVLEHKALPVTHGLAEKWRAYMPSPDTTDIDIMTDWVATLYYARKVVRCLEGLQQEHVWSAPAELEGKTALA
ncbi:FUSC family protein [Roseibium sp. HPY-6]|uniref:FUSC family protein n=1 Tax=Roseibium sp. HPY-6 TaxID=3229852 RepID=UPI0033900E86